jgi:putative lipoic acid-binding regulatory protein
VATICDLNLANKQVHIDYPCHWEYKIIVPAHVDVKGPLNDVLEGRTYSLTLSNNSKKGTYTSYSARVLVASHEERKALFSALKAHPSIKYVL